jgi:PST family polysaccharide transporter
MIVGIINVKVLAVMLGPVGVGLMGLYQNILGVASSLAGCGLGNSGVRQIAVSQEDATTLSIVRKALFYANVVLGISGMAILWLLREPVSHLVFGDTSHANEVGWLGLGVLLSLLAGSQTALLQGLRRIGDIARVNIISAVSSAILGVFAIWWMGMSGVLWFILVTPASSVLVAAWYVKRLPQPQGEVDWGELRKQWQAMFSMGIPVMAGGLSLLLTLLIARAMVLQELGLEASGFYQAAWAISMTYIGFVLNAMGMDYFPRLSSVKDDWGRANNMVNEQTEMALLLAGPVLIAMLTLAPWVIELLYAKSFSPSAEILRWQVMGDVIKIMAWPMGFVALAQARGGVYFFTQLSWGAVYLLVIWLGLSLGGLATVGISFFLAYVVLLGLVYGVAWRLTGFKATRKNFGLFAVLMFCVGATHWASWQSLEASILLGGVLTAVLAFYSLSRLNELMDMAAWINRKFERFRR